MSPRSTNPGGASRVRRRALLGTAVLVVLVALAGLAAYLTRDGRTSSKAPVTAGEFGFPLLPDRFRFRPRHHRTGARSALPVPPSTHDPIAFGKAAAAALWSYDTRAYSQHELLAALHRWLTSETKYADTASVDALVPSPRAVEADGRQRPVRHRHRERGALPRLVHPGPAGGPRGDHHRVRLRRDGLRQAVDRLERLAARRRREPRRPPSRSSAAPPSPAPWPASCRPSRPDRPLQKGGTAMGVCDLPLMDTVCDAVDFATNPGRAVTDGIGAWIAKSAGELAASAADLAAKAVNETTAIDLNAGWFRDNYELLLPIGLALTVGTFCIQLMFAAWRRDERALAQAAIGTMTGVLFSFCAVAFTSVAITVVDALSDGLFQAANSSVDDAIRRVVEGQRAGADVRPGLGSPSPGRPRLRDRRVHVLGRDGRPQGRRPDPGRPRGLRRIRRRLGGRQALAARLDRGHRHPGRVANC